MVLKPDWFLQMCSFEFNVVETERLVNVTMRDSIYSPNRSLQSSEGAITDDAHTTAWGKYLIVHAEGNAPKI